MVFLNSFLLFCFCFFQCQLLYPDKNTMLYLCGFLLAVLKIYIFFQSQLSTTVLFCSIMRTPYCTLVAFFLMGVASYIIITHKLSWMEQVTIGQGWEFTLWFLVEMALFKRANCSFCSFGEKRHERFALTALLKRATRSDCSLHSF